MGYRGDRRGNGRRSARLRAGAKRAGNAVPGAGPGGQSAFSGTAIDPDPTFPQRSGTGLARPVEQTRRGPLGRPIKACSNPDRQWARRLLGDLCRDARAIFARRLRRMRGGGGRTSADAESLADQLPRVLALLPEGRGGASDLWRPRSPDPDDNSALRTPPPLSERDEGIFGDFEKAGLRPFRSISASTMSPAARNVWAICVHGIASPREPAGV